jgi:hypothetical protein
MPVQPFNFAMIPGNGMPVADFNSVAQGLQIGAMPKDIKQRQQQQALQNALTQIQLQYAPDMTQAQLTQLQNQGALTGEQAKYYGTDVMSQVGLRGAQANLTNQQATYLPLQYIIDSTKAQQVGSRFGGSYQLAKMLSVADPAYRNTWISQNPQEYADMLTTLGNKALQEQDSKTSAPLNQAMAKYFPQFMQGQQAPPQQSQPQQMPPAMGAPQQQPPMAQQGAPMMPQGVQSGFNASTPDQVAQLQMASQLAANKALTTTATRRQNEGALQVEGIMNDPELQKKVINAAQYAGALGKGKADVAALSQKNPQAYEDYISFVNQDMVLLQNRIKSLDQMGATDAQRDELNGLYKKTMDSLTSNPKQFIQQFNQLGNSLDRVAKSVVKSASPVFQDNRYQGFNAIGGVPNTPVPPQMISQAINASQQAPQQSQAPGISSPQQMQMVQMTQAAQAAIAAGADPKMIQQRLKQMMGGG